VSIQTHTRGNNTGSRARTSKNDLHSGQQATKEPARSQSPSNTKEKRGTLWGGKKGRELKVSMKGRKKRR